MGIVAVAEGLAGSDELDELRRLDASEPEPEPEPGEDEDTTGEDDDESEPEAMPHG